MPLIEGAFRHASLAQFAPIQSLAAESGPETHLAQTKSGSLVVVKVLLDKPVPPDVGAALSHEGSLAARLTHGGIVQTRAMVIEDDVAAIITEFVQGVSLQRLLRFAAQRSVRLPDEAGWYVVESVLSALAFAHAQKDKAGAPAPVVHGSVGPESVVVGWDGAVKLGEFGRTRLRAILAPLTPALPSGEAAPVELMAPEQARGGKASERADVFCAALIALRVATGRTPYARFRDAPNGLQAAMAEGNVLPLSKTRPELPQAVLDAFGKALAVDPQARTVTAHELAEAVRASFDLDKGKAALAKLLGRWREQLEKSMTPWERRASMHDGVVETRELREGTLALAMADDRPSVDALVTNAQPDEPWKKDALPNAETPLAATDALESLSRLGAAAESAMSIPLPAVRMTMPSIPVYGPPVDPPPPPPPTPWFTGRNAALTVLGGFIVLAVAAVILMKWLLGPF